MRCDKLILESSVVSALNNGVIVCISFLPSR